MAESLNSVIEIYEYVRNNINFEAYYGSKKGAVGTLDQMAGNDIDISSNKKKPENSPSLFNHENYLYSFQYNCMRHN
ncbi:hypothetical protein [Acetivibrio saccincola]|uniref:hypothetical protein n=1 Tax=Acetivibrio saccincola TaxID=1677857 RepID=UPI000C6E7F59|nr:hypothetical protein [Acetivibrio saccincola]